MGKSTKKYLEFLKLADLPAETVDFCSDFSLHKVFSKTYKALFVDIRSASKEALMYAKEIRLLEQEKSQNPKYKLLPIYFYSVSISALLQSKAMQVGVVNFCNTKNLNKICSRIYSEEYLPSKNAKVAILTDNWWDEVRLRQGCEELKLNFFVFKTSSELKTELKSKNTFFNLLVVANKKIDQKFLDELHQLRLLEAFSDTPIVFVANKQQEKTLEEFDFINADTLSHTSSWNELLWRFKLHLKSATMANEMRGLIDEIFHIDKTKNHFLAACSHDLKSPLNSILGAAEILSDPGSVNPELKVFVNMIRESALFMGDIINDLLDLSAIQDQTKLKIEKVDLANLCKISLKAFQIQASKKRQILSMHINEDEKFLMMGNKIALRRMINNLVSNSIKFTPQLGGIKLELRHRDGKLVLNISDTGIGIPEEMMDKIFDSFTRAGREGTEGEQSTGLGLSLVKDIVQRMGGTISVESKVEKGTRFVIEFPAIVEAAEVA